jgi:PleD family two-component response regulator
MQVLVAEPTAPIANALKKFLDGVADVQVVHFLDEAVQRILLKTPDVVIATVSGSFEGEVLCAQVKKQAPEAGVVLMYPPTDFESAARRSEEAGADAFLVGPPKKHAVLSVVRACARLREANARVRLLGGEAAKLKEQLEALAKKPKAPKSKLGAGINTADEAFFKKYMLLEVKRSKRYQYPVALLLVGLDDLDAHLGVAGPPEAARVAIRDEALRVLGELLRDIDIAMSFAEDKFLVFLPHTPREGAMVVARRVLERLQRLSAFQGGTGSVGLAAFEPKLDPKHQVSFGGLVRQASELLKKAHAKGGNTIETNVPVGVTEPPKKKNRISMG